jgi:four helix bundle protein
MARTQFEKLRVYRLSEELSDAVWDMIKRWPEFARGTVGRQMTRAADGIGANLAEGAGRGTYVDNRRFIRMARGSLYEVKHWLRRAYKRELMSVEQVEHFRPLLDEFAPRLNAYRRSVSSRCLKTSTRARSGQTTNNAQRTTNSSA